MRLVPIPGVHRPVSDTWLLAEAIAREGASGRSVADLCCGSGGLAIVAARAGARSVLAVDISRRAVLVTLVNASLNRCAVSVRRGDLIDALDGLRFDLIACNPPYVPAATDALPRHRATTALDGGRDGRAVIDRVCVQARAHLEPGGSLLLVHSSVCDPTRTVALLGQCGLEGEVLRRVAGPLGPTMRERAAMLRSRGLLGAGDREELVVVRGYRPRVNHGAVPA